MFVVGIDGGGTKTRVAVCASDGTLLRRETLGAFNLSDIGEGGFRRKFRGGTERNRRGRRGKPQR